MTISDDSESSTPPSHLNTTPLHHASPRNSTPLPHTSHRHTTPLHHVPALAEDEIHPLLNLNHTKNTTADDCTQVANISNADVAAFGSGSDSTS